MFLQYILLLIHCDNSNNDGDDTRDWQGDEDAPPAPGTFFYIFFYLHALLMTICRLRTSTTNTTVEPTT